MTRVRQRETGSPRGRIRSVLIFLTVFGFIILGRFFYLDSFKHNYYVRAAASQHWAKDEIPAERGRIYVRDNAVESGLYPLAINKTLNLIYASPEDIKEKDQTAEKLAPIIGIDKQKILDSFNNNHTYVLLRHQLSYEQSDKVKSLKLAGVYLSPEPVRYYPEGTLASQLLGYVDGDGNGRYGIEQFFNDILAGVPGLYKAEISATGKTIAFGNNVSVEPKNGSDVVLTINRDIQFQAEKLLAASVQKFKARNGSIIVMDPKTGQILAMGNSPTYDPNNYKTVKDYNLFKNIAVTDEFEPGSIFKVLTVAAGLDSGKIQPDTKYTDTGTVVLNGNKIMNSDRKAHGLVDMTYVLEYSLNTGTTWIMQQMGKQTFYNYLKKFGFGVATGIEQPVEGVGFFNNPSDVGDHTMATMTFGQSISTTPLQMIDSFAAVANGGNLMKPHLVYETISPDGKTKVTPTEIVRRIMSPDASKKETQMMVGVVEVGHGKQAKVAGYKVAGKTGTAQVPAANGAGYDPNRNIGSFIGFGPAQDPKYVVMVKIDSPHGVPWAEESAAPVVGQMLDFLFKYAQIPPTEPVK